MKAVSLRPIVIEDFDQIMSIEKSSYPTPWSQDHFISEMKKPFARILALTDDETDSIIIGYIVYWVQAESVSLHNIAVSPHWRGLGFSKILMRSMINEAVRNEIAKTILEVRASNLGAISLYETLGFKKTHERKKFYQDGESAIIMELKTSDINSTLH
jgi:[ribosomal protein S18]-alanine N-acetyltransferase